MTDAVLYDYWRSSAAYRLRIAMNLAGISYQSISVDLLKGEHKTEAYLNRNPTGLVPVLEIDGHSLTQSLAILEYLNDTREMGLISSDPTSAAQNARLPMPSRLIFIPCAMFRLPPMRYNNQDGTKLVLNGCNGLLHLASRQLKPC